MALSGKSTALASSLQHPLNTNSKHVGSAGVGHPRPGKAMKPRMPFQQSAGLHVVEQHSTATRPTADENRMSLSLDATTL